MGGQRVNSTAGGFRLRLFILFLEIKGQWLIPACSGIFRLPDFGSGSWIPERAVSLRRVDSKRGVSEKSYKNTVPLDCHSPSGNNIVPSGFFPFALRACSLIA
jgi:hypothetical protein